MSVKSDALFIPLNIAVLTVSDTREYANDTSGQLLVSRLLEAGHTLSERNLLKDDLYKIRAQVAHWIAHEGIQVVLITGGTGFTGRDSTPEAVACLLDKQIDGFGPRHRHVHGAEPGLGRAGQWHAGVLPARVHRRLSHGVGRHSCRATGRPPPSV
jgi:molybdenum cofactor biosynthesis protein B